jgi:acyl-CoA-binding protein
MGKFRSRGPCGVPSSVQSYSQSLLLGKEAYLKTLWYAILFGCWAILAALGVLGYICLEGSFVKLNPEEQFYSLPCEDQFRWATMEAPKILNDQVPHEEKLCIYGLYNQAKYGDAKKVPPEKMPDGDYQWWDKWRSFQGMPESEAMALYVSMILNIGHYRTPNDHLGCWNTCGDDCLFQICGCWPVRKDFGISQNPGLPEWLEAKLDGR